MSDDRRAVPSGEVAAPGSAPARAIARVEAHEHRPLPDEAEERIGELLDLAGARDNRTCRTRWLPSVSRARPEEG